LLDVAEVRPVEAKLNV
jgi:hypothetical protein